MICLGKYSFMVLFLLENIFLGFLKEHMVSGWKISLVLFFIAEFFFSINMANDCFIAIEMVQAIKKKIIKGNCEASLEERVVAEKG